MIKFIKESFTDSTGKISAKRISACLMVASFCGLAWIDVIVNKHPFDYLNYGTGAAALCSALALWFGTEKIGT